MSFESVNNVLSSSAAATYAPHRSDSSSKASSSTSTQNSKSKTKIDKNSSSESDAVVYEKNNTNANSSNKLYSKNSVIDRSALVAQLKAESEERINSFKDMVSDMLTQQGKTIGKADDIWSFLADGNFTVTEAAKKKAQEEISDDGYWGVEKTSERIVSFAIALSGDDKSKADLLINAFKKGYSDATKTWGKELPDISKKTYDAVMDKFDKWKNGEYPPTDNGLDNE